MFIRILKYCILGKPGRSIMMPTRKQIAFAKCNPTIARLVYKGAEISEPVVPAVVEPIEPIVVPMVEPRLTPKSEDALEELYEKKHGKKPVESAKKPKRTYTRKKGVRNVKSKH